MKKPLFIAAAAVLLASGLTAGVLASYSTTLDADSATITAKQFTFLRADSGDTVVDVKLAPGESKEYTVAVKNFNEGYISEVDMNVSFVIADATGDLAPALTVEASTETSFVLHKDVAETATLKFVVTFVNHGEGEDNQYIDKTASISVSAKGTQVIA